MRLWLVNFFISFVMGQNDYVFSNVNFEFTVLLIFVLSFLLIAVPIMFIISIIKLYNITQIITVYILIMIKLRFSELF